MCAEHAWTKKVEQRHSSATSTTRCDLPDPTGACVAYCNMVHLDLIWYYHEVRVLLVLSLLLHRRAVVAAFVPQLLRNPRLRGGLVCVPARSYSLRTDVCVDA
eukprot:4838940-Pleurochrysis_carterae.AAC.4